MEVIVLLFISNSAKTTARVYKGKVKSILIQFVILCGFRIAFNISRRNPNSLFYVFPHRFLKTDSSWARFLKAPGTFRARKAIFSSSISKNG